MRPRLFHRGGSSRRWWIAFSVLALALAAATQALHAQDDPVKENDRELGQVTRTFAIRNARIVQAPGRVIERGTIVMRNGVIVAVGQNVAVPFDAQVIEGDSMVVYAGFIDGLSHAGVPAPKKPENLPKVAVPGDPPNDRAGIQPDRDVRTLLAPGDASVDSLRMAGFTVAHVVPYGLMLPGAGAIVSLAGDTPGEMVLRGGASMAARFAPADDIYPATTMAIMAKFRDLYNRARQVKTAGEFYGENPAGMERPKQDPVLDAFLPVIDGKAPVVFQANGPLEVYRALALQKDLGFQLVIGGLREAYDIADLIKSRNLPLFLSLDLPKEKKADDAKDSTAKGADSAGRTPTNFFANRHIESFHDVKDEQSFLTQQQRGARRVYYGTAGMLRRQGVRFGFSSVDSKLGDVRENLRMMVENGLSENDALAALTVDPARMLGLEKQLGTVENGKIANLVMTSGNYFNEKAQVRYVFVDGRMFEYNRPTGKKDSAKAGADTSAAKTADAKTPDVKATDAKKNDPDTLIANPALARRRDAGERGSLLIRNATVLTVTKGVLENTDIVVRNGKIDAIGKGLSAPSGGRTIDASGMFVMPGIIDAHSHIAISDVNEWTNPVTAEVWTGDVVDPYDLAVYRALAGGVTTSHVMHGSANAIGGQCETIKHRYGTTDPAGLVMEGAPRTIKFALGENPTRVHGRGFGVHPSTRMGVEDIFRQSFSEAKRYMEAKTRYERERKDNPRVTPPAYSLRLETLAAILRGEILVHCHSYRADEILMLMKVFRDFGIKRLTFQHVNEGFKVAPELAEFGAMASVFSDWWSYKFEVYYSTAYNAAILTRNGVVTSINSDSPELNRHLYHEAAKTLKYGGLSPEEALKLITINPARQLGIDDRVGSIEVGKEADLAIFNADPLSIYAVCQKTIVDGVVRFDRSEDPDDMRLNIDVKRAVDVHTVYKENQDRCMQGTDAFHQLFIER